MSSKWILSATEIETFTLCQRKWGYQYLEGLRPSPSKAAEFGSNVHNFLQKHFTDAPVDYESDEGRVVKPGLQFLPKNMPAHQIERQIFFSVDGHIFMGYIDFFDQVGSQTWLIGDHKTCSSFSSALSPGELQKNIQANVYAKWAFKELNADVVQLKWVYYRTKGNPEARIVETSLTKSESELNFAPIAKAADEIKNLVDTKICAASLPKNQASCFKYGRCPFYADCKYGVTKDVSVPSPAQPIETADDPSFHLYIDCTPTKPASDYEQTLELSDLLKPVLLKIQTEKELKHYRLAGYGQHVGLIANYLSEHLKNTAYDNRTAILTSMKTPEGCDTLQTLMGGASRVVRGF